MGHADKKPTHPPPPPPSPSPPKKHTHEQGLGVVAIQDLEIGHAALVTPIGAQLRADSGVQCVWCVAAVCCSSVLQQCVAAVCYWHAAPC